MTDTSKPTAEDFEIASRVARFDDHPGLADVWQTCAEVVRAGAARAELAEKLAREFHKGVLSVRDMVEFDQLDQDYREALEAGARAALNFLGGDGRQLPEGGAVNVVDLHHTHAFGADSDDCPACRQRAEMNLPSAPVPDGTPEKPWPTWDAVPEGVRVQDGAFEAAEFAKRDGRVVHYIRRSGAKCCVDAFGASDLVPPFVRAEGNRR